MPPIDVMRSYLDAMRSGNRNAAFDHFADDVVGYVPGRSTLAGTRRGRAEVEGYIVEVRIFEADQYAVDAWFD